MVYAEIGRPCGDEERHPDDPPHSCARAATVKWMAARDRTTYGSRDALESCIAERGGRILFKQEFPALELSLERGTDRVPHDGHYHLVVAGQVVSSHASEGAATKEYARLRARLIEEVGWNPSSAPVSRDVLLNRLRLEADAHGVLAESTRNKRANRTRKGGKGR